MALLFPAGLRLFDANGNPLSGAKVRVYTANTTTLASLFSDAALSSSITNPVITDAAGYPANGGNKCAIQVAAGSYDVAFLDSNNNLLASWDDYVPWGSESGDIDRTVTGNGRFKITGSGGAVLLQAGDPSPDNTGGTVTLEGWAGTQADTITLDGAIVNATGRLKENGKKVNTVQTEATTFTAAATVDIALPNVPSGVRHWRVTIYDLTFASAAQPRLRVSYSASLKSGASDYAYVVNYYSVGSAAMLRGSAAAAAEIVLHGENWNATGTIGSDKTFRVTLDIITPNSGTQMTQIDWTACGYTTEATALPARADGNGYGLRSYGRADSIRLYNSAGGNMSGKYTVEAIVGTGD